jgi:transcriptional regulator with XRE-family HTH domain
MTSVGAARWPVWALAKEARRRAGLTQAEVAARARTSQPAIASYERARTMPDLTTLFRIIEACGLELHLELREPSSQRRAAEEAAMGRTVEERLATNESFTELAAELRRE